MLSNFFKCLFRTRADSVITNDDLKVSALIEIAEQLSYVVDALRIITEKGGVVGPPNQDP